jgi:hypothetical protein
MLRLCWVICRFADEVPRAGNDAVHDASSFERLGVSYANAAVRIHRLREKLRNGLKPKQL